MVVQSATKKRSQYFHCILQINQASRLECALENYILYFSPKTYVVGTQNTCLNLWERNYLQLYANEISLSGSMTSCCLSVRPS